MSLIWSNVTAFYQTFSSYLHEMELVYPTFENIWRSTSGGMKLESFHRYV